MSRVRGHRGSLLIITLWMVATLSVLAVATARYLSTEVRLTKLRLAREQAKTLARSGVYLAMQRLKEDAAGESSDPNDPNQKYDWLGDDWAVFTGGDPQDLSAWIVPVSSRLSASAGAGDELRVHITDEDRKFDLNALTDAAKPTDRAKLDQLLGVPGLAQSIVDYADTDTTSTNSTPEVDNPPYAQKNGSVVVLEELLDVPGMTPEAFSTLQASTFAVPGTGRLTAVNINTAEPQVLSAITTDSSVVEAILQLRSPPGHFFKSLSTTPVLDDSAILPPALTLANSPFNSMEVQRWLKVTSNIFRVEAVGQIGRPAVQYRVEAIVQREDCGTNQPKPCIVGWHEG